MSASSPTRAPCRDLSDDARLHYWMQVGVSSLPSPLWARIVAAAHQFRVTEGKAPLVVDGQDGDTLQAALYGLDDVLFDATSGSNGQ